MTIKRTVSERVSTTVPHDLFVRFLRSLGASIPPDARLHVNQPPSYSDPYSDINVSWDLSETKTEREVSLMDPEDIELLAGLRDVEKDIPF